MADSETSEPTEQNMAEILIKLYKMCIDQGLPTLNVMFRHNGQLYTAETNFIKEKEHED
jgi:hypothetical protein